MVIPKDLPRPSNSNELRGYNTYNSTIHYNNPSPERIYRTIGYSITSTMHVIGSDKMDFVKMYKWEFRLWRRHPDYRGNNRYKWQKQRNEQKKYYGGMTPDMRMANHG